MFFPNMYEDYSRGTRTWFVTCLLFTFASFVEYFLVICCGMRRTLRYTNGLLESDHPVTTKEVTTTTISMNNSSFNKRAPLPLCSSLNLSFTCRRNTTVKSKKFLNNIKTCQLRFKPIFCRSKTAVWNLGPL